MYTLLSSEPIFGKGLRYAYFPEITCHVTHTLFVGLTREEILPQCFAFFLAGYDTSGATLSFFLYSLAMHQHVQEKVAKEIQEILPNGVSIIAHLLSIIFIFLI